MWVYKPKSLYPMKNNEIINHIWVATESSILILFRLGPPHLLLPLTRKHEAARRVRRKGLGHCMWPWFNLQKSQVNDSKSSLQLLPIYTFLSRPTTTAVLKASSISKIRSISCFFFPITWLHAILLSLLLLVSDCANEKSCSLYPERYERARAYCPSSDLPNTLFKFIQQWHLVLSISLLNDVRTRRNSTGWKLRWLIKSGGVLESVSLAATAKNGAHADAEDVGGCQAGKFWLEHFL